MSAGLSFRHLRSRAMRRDPTLYVPETDGLVLPRYRGRHAPWRASRCTPGLHCGLYAGVFALCPAHTRLARGAAARVHECATCGADCTCGEWWPGDAHQCVNPLCDQWARLQR